MVTMQPPPAYGAGHAPPPAFSGLGGEDKTVYWSYWGVLFATFLTWIFAVSAAGSHAWFQLGGVSWGLSYSCPDGSSSFCTTYEAAKAFQYLATLIVSVVLILVGVAAFSPAAMATKLGRAVGIMLAVFSLCEMIAFACAAAAVAELNKFYTYLGYEYSLGGSFGVAVVAWIFGVAGAVVTLVLLRRATTDHDGPFRALMVKATTQAGAPPPATGTV